jgi:transcriptional regulator of acetoin/glycerol metabolism
MQPGHGSLDRDFLQEAWETFTATGSLCRGVDPLVAISWQRCAPRLNPRGSPQWAGLGDEVLRLTLKQHAPLTSIARPLLEDTYQFIEGSGVALLLADGTSCVLDVMGDADILAEVTSLGIRQGMFLDESRIGTNAFATALIEGGPAEVVGHEHFLTFLHGTSTAAAPIFDLDGHTVGAVGLIERAAQRSPLSLGVALATARAIENQLQAGLFVNEAHARASELHATLFAISEGVLAWTAQGLILYLNDQAGQLLGLTPAVVVGRPLGEYITLPEGLARAVSQGEELTDAEISLSVKGAKQECLASLRVIRDAAGVPQTYIATLRRIEQVRKLVNRLVGAQARLTLDDVVGGGPAARRVRHQALAAAEAKACLLLIGESGTGKNLLARAIHNSSSRAGGPFLGINCRALPRELVLGDFLGFDPGSFNSGPSSGQPSKFELAHGGTLFLEEVEALPFDVQAALQRVIEARDVIRLGGTRVIPVDVRVITATAMDLEARVAEGAFRPDLLYRLSSFVITIPPLRDRPEDIPLVIERTLAKLSTQLGQPLGLTNEAHTMLCAYPWPGNVRELESALERAALQCEGQPIRPDHLPAVMRQRRAISPGKPTTEPVRSLKEVERLAILTAGRAAGGNLTRAAQLLGIGRTTLWRKIRELGVSAEDLGRPEKASADTVSQ